jgi:hypothetical protein
VSPRSSKKLSAVSPIGVCPVSSGPRGGIAARSRVGLRDPVDRPRQLRGEVPVTRRSIARRRRRALVRRHHRRPPARHCDQRAAQLDASRDPLRDLLRPAADAGATTILIRPVARWAMRIRSCPASAAVSRPRASGSTYTISRSTPAAS